MRAVELCVSILITTFLIRTRAQVEERKRRSLFKWWPEIFEKEKPEEEDMLVIGRDEGDDSNDNKDIKIISIGSKDFDNAEITSMEKEFQQIRDDTKIEKIPNLITVSVNKPTVLSTELNETYSLNVTFNNNSEIGNATGSLSFGVQQPFKLLDVYSPHERIETCLNNTENTTIYISDCSVFRLQTLNGTYDENNRCNISTSATRALEPNESYCSNDLYFRPEGVYTIQVTYGLNCSPDEIYEMCDANVYIAPSTSLIVKCPEIVDCAIDDDAVFHICSSLEFLKVCGNTTTLLPAFTTLKPPGSNLTIELESEVADKLQDAVDKVESFVDFDSLLNGDEDFFDFTGIEHEVEENDSHSEKDEDQDQDETSQDESIIMEEINNIKQEIDIVQQAAESIVNLDEIPVYATSNTQRTTFSIFDQDDYSPYESIESCIDNNLYNEPIYVSSCSVFSLSSEGKKYPEVACATEGTAIAIKPGGKYCSHYLSYFRNTGLYTIDVMFGVGCEESKSMKESCTAIITKSSTQLIVKCPESVDCRNDEGFIGEDAKAMWGICGPFSTDFQLQCQDSIVLF